MNMTPIATVASPFKEKFGIPRQACLIKHAEGKLLFHPPFDNPDAFCGLDDFSHIWLQFGFSENLRSAFKPSVRPPRLGGNKTLGVFATRSSFRPNALGLSLVELRKVVIEKGSTSLIISCPDLLDGTPIYDIKPFIKYTDQPESSSCGFASEPPRPTIEVAFTNQASRFLDGYSSPEGCTTLKLFISEIIGFDPRPAYQKDSPERVYGMRIYDLNIRWRVDHSKAIIETIEQVAAV